MTNASGKGGASAGSTAKGGSAGQTNAGASGASTGGSSAAGGSGGKGGAGPAGAGPGVGGSVAGAAPAGGSSGAGGTPPAAGASGSGGAAAGSGGSSTADCTFTVMPSVSERMATVGVVEWTTTLADLASAKVVYNLNGAADSILNKGGEAPVTAPEAGMNRTLLLGLKPSSMYTAHVEATSAGGGTCRSEDFMVSTGNLQGAPNVMRMAANPAAQAGGFIITGGGVMGSTPIFIIDADGAVVWSMSGPASCSRARMDWDGKNMWMMALNVQNSGGEMRYVGMDGSAGMNNVSGLSKAHHDFTVLPGNVIATMAWSGNGADVESDLIERSPDGMVRTVFHIGSNLYQGGPSELGGGANSYHCNSVLYQEFDDSYTIGDRNPNVYVKVSRAGMLQWQFGGSCSGAPASKCAAGTWEVNHGHHLFEDGTFLLFNNGPFRSTTASRGYEFKLNDSGSTLTAMEVESYASSGNEHSDSLGDIQRLANGNTLITFSNTGTIQELSPAWTVVQTLKVSSLGYSEWRQTMYGPPAR
jgi:hypothetical protein